jgi:hypothetical protein
MADIYSLAGRARGKLVQQASRKDPDMRRILGHAKLLDSLVMELSVGESTWNENEAQDEVVAGSEGGRCYPKDFLDSDDSDSDSESDSDSDSDSDWDSDTDSDMDSDSSSERHSDEDFEKEGPGDFSYEESCDDCGAESTARDWAQMEFWETAKPIVGGRHIQVSVDEARDEIES